MRFVVIVTVALSLPFERWASAFDAEDTARRGAGVETVFRYAVIGRQEAVFAMSTEEPRLVHDMMYDPAIRPAVEASGLVVGTERIVLLDARDNPIFDGTA